MKHGLITSTESRRSMGIEKQKQGQIHTMKLGDKRNQNEVNEGLSSPKRGRAKDAGDHSVSHRVPAFSEISAWPSNRMTMKHTHVSGIRRMVRKAGTALLVLSHST